MPNNDRISERELVLPSLYLMTLNKGKITTTELIQLLTQLMKPRGRDAQIITNRNDTFFSQKVRNLRSHGTLERDGYVVYIDGVYHITQEGRNLISKHGDSINYLFGNVFDYNDISHHMADIYDKRDQIIFPCDEVIIEGESKYVTAKTKSRSQRLRNAAVDYFSHDGIICCDCCGFESRSFYGDMYGLITCIEIHHILPIFQYEGEKIEQTLNNALMNLLPVCPNCHRIIHKNHITKEMLPDFKKRIQLHF